MISRHTRLHAALMRSAGNVSFFLVSKPSAQRQTRGPVLLSPGWRCFLLVLRSSGASLLPNSRSNAPFSPNESPLSRSQDAGGLSGELPMYGHISFFPGGLLAFLTLWAGTYAPLC